jgi:hypothetical protein
MSPELLKPVYIDELKDQEITVGYMPSGERVSLLGNVVMTSLGTETHTWETLQVRYRNGYYDPASYGMRKDSQAVYTLRREAPPEHCMPGLMYQYATLTLLMETLSFTLQGQGTYPLSENPPAADLAA